MVLTVVCTDSLASPGQWALLRDEWADSMIYTQDYAGRILDVLATPPGFVKIKIGQDSPNLALCSLPKFVCNFCSTEKTEAWS